MRGSRRLAPLLALWLASVGGITAAAPNAELASRPAPNADHLGGSFTTCGRVSAFTAPLPATPGSLTVEGVVDFGPHTFPVDETATVDPLLAGLAVAGEWTCLELVGDGAGVLTSLAVSSATTQCGRIQAVTGSALGERAGSTHEFTTIVLDGDAATVIAADANLTYLLEALARALGNSIVGPAEACLNLTFAGDGQLAGIALDYNLFVDQGAVIACGQVDGTPLEYRDPASQPYPAAGILSVDGFELDATLLHPAFQEVLAFHLDAGLDLCLFVHVVDTAIVEAGILTFGVPDGGRQVCGRLEVIGGLTFVDRVLVGHGMMALEFAEPTPSSIDSACAEVGAQWNGGSSQLDICGEFQGVGQNTVMISGVTFHFEAPVVGGVLPETGGPQAIVIAGPFMLAPFDSNNPLLVAQGNPPVCSGELPNTGLTSPENARLPVSIWLVLATLSLAALLVAALRSRRSAGIG